MTDECNHGKLATDDKIGKIRNCYYFLLVFVMNLSHLKENLDGKTSEKHKELLLPQ